MSFDPHIDIDELDSPAPVPKPAGQPAAPDSEWDPDEPAGLLSLGDAFYNLLKQMRHLQERLTPGGAAGIIPPSINRHMRAAQREFLLAWRSLIDLQLQRLEKQEQEHSAAGRSNTTEPEL